MNGFKQFVEMPLSNYRVAPFKYPEEERNKKNLAIHQFDRLDRKIITLDKTQNCLRKALERHDYNFNFILMEADKNYRSSQYERMIIDYMKENNIPLENHITFATNSSTGHPATCWMLLHKFGHALFDDVSYHIYGKEIKSAINRIGRSRVTNIFKFKSARNSNFNSAVNDTDELVFELVAEYLWHGRIRFDDTDPELRSFVQLAETNIEKALSNAVGKIILDFFYE